MADVHPPFLFVVGAGRSGTSVLRTVLDSHSQLAVSHEGRFVTRYRDRPYLGPDGFDVDAFLADLAGDRAVTGNLQLDIDAARVALTSTPVADYPDAVRRVFAVYAASRGKPRYGDKFPAYVQHLPTLATMFPEARFVHIIRDGRDVALSNLAIPAESHPIVTLALDWRHRVAAGRRDGRRLGPARYLEVRYEALISDGEATVARLCEFLDLAPEPAMLDFTRRDDAVPAKVQANPRHARLAEPLSFGPRSWRRDLRPVHLERWEAAAGDLLDELGYERGAPAPSIAARAAAIAGRARWNAQRARARLPGMARRALRRIRPT